MKRHGRMAIMLAAAWAAAGCAGVGLSGPVRYGTARVSIETDPPGARVLQLQPQGAPAVDLGTTPLERTVRIVQAVDLTGMDADQARELARFRDQLVVEIRKDGYRPVRHAEPVDAAGRVALKLTLAPIEE